MRTCNACTRLETGETPEEYYESSVKPFFFEKVTGVNDKTYFRNECLLSKFCVTEKSWLDTVFESFVYPTNLDDAENVDSPFL